MKKQTLTFSIIPFFVLIVLLMKGTLNDQQSFPHLEFWAYHWRIPISEKDSSYKFILDYYIEIDSSKSCRVVRRSIDHYPKVVFEYFRLNLPDSIVQYIYSMNLGNMINKIDFPKTRGGFYCGSTFLIQYYSATGQVINYRFIPPIESDSNYIKFQKVIENTIRNTLSDNISSFNIQEKINYIIENIEDSSKFPKFQGVIKFKKP